MSRALAALVIAVALSACGEAARESQLDYRPTFEASTLSGDHVSLASLKGSPVLVNVWATWCAPCRQEIPFLADLYAEHRASGFRVIGVSIDAASDLQKVRETAPALGISYDIWLDPEERIAGVMRYAGVPASMLIGRDGAIQWKHVGVIREDTPGFDEALHDVLAIGSPH
jgi:thiol-disulfide isomerase/thioredoxin